MKSILGTKIGMTRIFDKSGKSIPVSVIEAGPCFVTELKNSEKNGYDAVQLGFGYTKHSSKPMKGHLGKIKDAKDHIKNLKFFREFRVDDKEIKNIHLGAEFKAENFKPGDIIEIAGISKGKGFQGTVKRHKFRTGPKTHGSDNYRQPGSIGATYPQRTIKGRRMSGHMGHEHVTVKGLQIIDVIPENNLILIKGATPGPKNSLLWIKGIK